MTELARRYEHGIGCPRDIGRALLYYKRAAAAGDGAAMVALGDLYREGVCVERDLPYALDMYRRAAEADFAPGMMRYAEATEHRGLEDSKTWYRKAADQGYGPAMTRLGDLTGDASWYRKAVAVEHPPAFAKLAAIDGEDGLGLLRRGSELGDAAAQSALARSLESSDPNAAAKLYRQAAEGGDAFAMARWAHFSEKGIAGVPHSPGEALMWYSKAADAGEPSAIGWLALHRNDEILLKKAATAGHAPSMARLAIRTGNTELLRAAAERGDADAMFRLGGEWVVKAADLGHPEALAKLGRTEAAASSGHIASLMKLGRIREAAELGDPEALYQYGREHSDKAEGTLWIERAAEAGHTLAMRELGIRYSEGSAAPLEPAKGQEWLGRAADKGDAEALFRTGKVQRAAELGHPPAMVRYGELTGDRKWFERAAAAGYANAWTKLGELQRAATAGDPEAKTLLGDKARSARQAVRLYREAADTGYGPAMLRLGDCHLEGRGASRSEIDAINWYRRAARAGMDEALLKLKRLGKGL